MTSNYKTATETMTKVARQSTDNLNALKEFAGFIDKPDDYGLIIPSLKMVGRQSLYEEAWWRSYERLLQPERAIEFKEENVVVSPKPDKSMLVREKIRLSKQDRPHLAIAEEAKRVFGYTKLYEKY